MSPDSYDIQTLSASLDGRVILGRSPTADRYGKFAIDELLFWDEQKDITFINSLITAFATG